MSIFSNTNIYGMIEMKYFPRGGGGHSNGKREYQARPWTHKKHPNHVFSGMKIDPKYAFLHAFFLICVSCPFQNLSIWPKTHPFFHFCTPKRCTRVQCLVLKNNPNYVNFRMSLIPPLTFEWPPRVLARLYFFEHWKNKNKFHFI